MTLTPHFEGKYLGELRTTNTHLKSSTTLITDAPTDNHGKGEAFSPTDLVCVALATCMTTVMGIAAQKENIDLNGLSYKIQKIMQLSPRTISEIRIIFEMNGKRLNADDKQKLVDVALNCPVALCLKSDLKQAVIFDF